LSAKDTPGIVPPSAVGGTFTTVPPPFIVTPAAFACLACSTIEPAVLAAAAFKRPPATFEVSPLNSGGGAVATICPLLWTDVGAELSILMYL
jgi:hypothetical protein